MAEDLKDPRRTEPDFLLGDRAMLEAWLEFHRVTLVLKCEGLTDEQRKRRSVPTSNLSLHGILRHMAEVERSWFGRVLLRDQAIPPLWFDPDVEDSEFVPLDGANFDADLAAFLTECDTSRATAASRSLDDTGLTRGGSEVSLRWILTHMIEEYARHNGHADLLRELVGGSVGW
jgi:uncharacterized damage-inducible protein DinB